MSTYLFSLLMATLNNNRPNKTRVREAVWFEENIVLFPIESL